MQKTIIEDRINTFQKDLYQHGQQATRYALLRAAAFIATAVLLFLYVRQDENLYLAFAIAPSLLFIYWVNRYSFHEEKKTYFRELISINKEEITRLELKLSSFKTGQQYFVKDHAYQYDLDVFGDHSLFQVLNRCALEDSEQLLAKWASDPASSEEILQRQVAIKELSQKTDWFQDFLANSRIALKRRKKGDPTVSANALISWAQKKSTLLHTGLWRISGFLLVLTMLVLIVVSLLDIAPYQIIYLSVVLNGLLLGLTISKLKPMINAIDKAYFIVSTYRQAICAIEYESFASEKLKALQAQLLANGKASQQIEKLTRITRRIDSRNTPQFYIILDMIFLLDVFLLVDVIQWKNNNQEHIAHWFEAIHEFEALISIAGFVNSNPHLHWPTPSETVFYLNGQSIGHPLIDAQQMVCNDYHIDGKGSVDIITGSNMSGKSTFQRTLGVNIVLANMGAPVYAESFKWSPCRVFTSMRTKDNLEENTSSFYAELKRIRQLLDLVAQEPVFFLLDEILKGTNSEDRHKGAIALALKLTQKSGFGMISTHDLSLGELAENHEEIRNFSFNSQIIEDKIKFDYLLTPGTCKSFNASQLMKNMGIID